MASLKIEVVGELGQQRVKCRIERNPVLLLADRELEAEDVCEMVGAQEMYAE
jgi:hypothetical protein